MTTYRHLGPTGLDAYLRAHGAQPAAALDAVCAQRDAHTSLLYWFTDLDAALAEARRTSRPILSLRLLGRLDEERSCANSRFFRKLLYPEPRINQVLRQDFVLHWQPVRPVPIVTLDFGDGRRIERTLTGNSVHLVLDARGRAVDALPGLFAPEAFLELLADARAFGRAAPAALPSMHARTLRARAPGDPVAPSRATVASQIAMTKHVVEGPLLRAVALDPLDADTARNHALHRRVHELFAAGIEWPDLDALVAWIYAELFEMPLHDPALGLDVPDPFEAPGDVRTPRPPRAAPPRSATTRPGPGSARGRSWAR